ncbi:immune inhibitor A domain-containing protein [Chengkuizengella sediminis]|uniref:immune inhibitor A domain-containing protein n=1 Tax=Chengkuizengella sediminis TaxID=1885917 RepID=UPI001389EFD0|nr:immune inhibitor A domain-containing protein [Chengkuizengella sediminis]NDI36194.1 M6 family metalloprotease domain-containing protein [Chengkuizengella sediminis]
MKKFLSAAMALALGVSILSPALAKDDGNKSIESFKETTYSHNSHLSASNEDRVIEMLKDSGYIADNASPEESQLRLKQYIQEFEDTFTKQKGELYSNEVQRQAYLMEQYNNSPIVNGAGNKLGLAEEVESVDIEDWDGSTQIDNVLVLLIEYPDYPATSIQPEDTDHYYDEYSKEHYENLVFGENGYIGPNGETFISVKQFYEQQSGGSYSIDGEIAGWYMAQNPAAYYGGNIDGVRDKNRKELILEALDAVGQDEDVDLSKFDIEDRYDLDGDGNYRESDGIIDHLMIVHSSVGEDDGGGGLGSDAIWSYRWNLEEIYDIPGTDFSAYDYTMQPASGAPGVFAHEYGHDLGLPDEYDTSNSGLGEPISHWSIMARGSWSGTLPGTEPSGFSPFAKEFIQATIGGNWLTGTTIDLDDIDSEGIEVLIDQASSKGTNHDVVKIQLPEKVIEINEPFSGSYAYHSGKGDYLNHSLITSVDLSDAIEASLTFKTWYEIEQDFDFASIQVKEENSNVWVTIPGNITTEEGYEDRNPGHGITGHSNGWIDGIFDLSDFAGQSIELKFNYLTDTNTIELGLWVDEIEISVDGEVVIFDDAESESAFSFDGFKLNEGKFIGDHYYLLEWRNHQGVDEGLAHIKFGKSIMQYDPGLVVWYVDHTADNNAVGSHPGEGFLGVVDADQHTITWSDRYLASTRYQVHDAAFSLNKTEKLYVDYNYLYGADITDNFTQQTPLFDDSQSYLNSGQPDAGRNIPNYGLRIRVIGESDDQSVGKILIFR